ncbi:hypothetical protein Bca4012_010339 [Brassica carinata]
MESRPSNLSFLNCTLHPCLSASGDQEVLTDVAFVRDNEVTDERVDHMLDLITKRHKWSTSMWDFDESVVTFLQEGGDIVTKLSAEDVADGINAVTTPAGGESSVTGSKRTRNKIADHGAETRKTKLFCKRASEAQGTLNEEKLEKKIESEVQASFSALEEKMESEIKASLSALEGKMEKKIESEIKLFKEAMEKGNGQSSKGKEPTSSKAKDEMAKFESLHDVKVTQTPDIELELNTQDTFVKGFDPSHTSMEDDLDEWLTPPTLLRTTKTPSPRPQKVIKKNKIPSLLDSDDECPGKDDPDAPLVHFSSKEWNRLEEWSRCPK